MNRLFIGVLMLDDGLLNDVLLDVDEDWIGVL